MLLWHWIVDIAQALIVYISMFAIYIYLFTGAACNNIDGFPYTYRTSKDSEVKTVTVKCSHSNS